MGVIDELLSGISIPSMAKVRQTFMEVRANNIADAFTTAFQQESAKVTWPVSGEVAVVVGSRGIANLKEVTQATVSALQARGLKPFLIPGMGSHGGATADGQAEVLASFGITESSMGVPIRASMEVIQVGSLPNGLPVYMDKIASEAEGIVVINRIKPHTAFRGKYESGIIKMIAIGLGKQKGAEACHKLGFGYMAEQIVQAAEVSLATKKILCGVAVIENAYDQIAEIQVLPASEMMAREPALLERAKSYMPRILVDDIDVLVVDELGKDISGDGMDPNITGRYPTPFATGGPSVRRICVRRLTERTHGNGNGLGVADFTTRDVFETFDFDMTYPNALTSTVPEPVKMPMVLRNDKLMLQAAIKTANVMDDHRVRIVHIRSTLRMDEIRVSESLVDEMKAREGAELVSELTPWAFHSDGSLDDARTWSLKDH